MADQTALEEAQKQIQALEEAKASTDAELARLRESNILRDARDQVREALSGSALHEMTQTRLSTELIAKAPIKEGALDREAFAETITAAIDAATQEAAAYMGSGQIRGMGVTAQVSDEDVSKALEAEFVAAGFSESAAAQMVARG